MARIMVFRRRRPTLVCRWHSDQTGKLVCHWDGQLFGRTAITGVSIMSNAGPLFTLLRANQSREAIISILKTPQFWAFSVGSLPISIG
jgi:hypothetical protein